jgi:hypothetical protein
MTIDPRLVQLLGNKLYTMSPFPICLRELLQNAQDACLRKGVKPEITITVESEDGFTVITCQDNGIGMTDQQIVDDFLCLGNVHHDGAKTVGGFGIAKAAFMRNPKWYIHSLDNELDEKVLMEGAEIRKTDMLEGTIVKIWIADNVGYTQMKEGIAMLRYSDIDITLNWFGWEIDHVGFHPEKPPAEMEIGNEYIIYGTDENRINTTQYDFEYEGMAAIRLSGLVQFMWDSYNQRETLLVVDIKPTTAPDDPKYAFNMSREKLRQDLNARVWEFITMCDNNIASTQDIVKEIQQPPDEKIKIGPLIRGRRSSARYSYGVSSSTEVSFSLPKRETERKEGRGVMMFFKDYHPEGRDIGKDAYLLKAWHEMIEMCASDQEEFGIGFLKPGSEMAGRQRKDGIVFYLIDPDILVEIEQPYVKAMILYEHAVHEVTHFLVSSHNEMFTQEMMEIKRETALIFLESHENFANLL